MKQKGETVAQEEEILIRLSQCGRRNRIRCSTKPCLAEHLNLERGLGWSGPWWDPYLCPVGRSALFSSTWYLCFMQAPECLTNSGSAVRRTRKSTRESYFLSWMSFQRLDLKPGHCSLCLVWVSRPDGLALHPVVTGDLFPAVPLWSSGPHKGLAPVFSPRCLGSTLLLFLPFLKGTWPFLIPLLFESLRNVRCQ